MKTKKKTVMTWMNRLLKLFHLYGHIYGFPGIQPHLNSPYDTTS